MEAVDVTVVAADGVPAAAATLARAFHDDPVMAWLFPDPDRRARTLEPFYRSLLTHAVVRHGHLYMTDDHAGVAAWNPPGTWKMNWITSIRMAPAVLRGVGRRLPTILRGWNHLDAHHPSEPHWYLTMIGTEPASQGRGVGTALLEPILSKAERQGAPVYLESSKESNIAFYLRHGFKLTGELAIPGGPTLWPMWRR